MRVGRAGVERDELPVAEVERDAARPRACGSRSAARGRAREQQRRELVQQAGLGADPVVLHPRAQLGELAQVVRRLLAREREQREASAASSAAEEERPLPRGRSPVISSAPGASVVAGGAAARRPCRARTRASPSRALGRRRTRRARRGRARRPRSASARRRGDGDAAVDRERHREPVVVVGVLADQVDAAGAERDDPLRQGARA